MPRFGRFPPLAALRLIHEAAGMTSRREKEDQQNHGRTESYGPAIYGPASNDSRSEEHTSEIQSLRHLVFRPLLEKKNRTAPEHVARHLAAGQEEPARGEGTT